jgi:hypothetical protein
MKKATGELTLTSTLQEVKNWLRSNFKKGCECPACGQDVKMYTRKINSSMAAGLILLHKSGIEDYFHIEEYLKNINCSSAIRGDIPKLRFWGLIERKEETREDGSNRAGYYRISEKGKSFIRGEITVPKAAYLYNNKCHGFSEDHTDIKTALGDKFDFQDLMNDDTFTGEIEL